MEDTTRILQPAPGPFPVELAARCIASTDAQIVLDPFMGSGTTAVAAMMHSRDYLGIDVSREYCKMAESRMRDYAPPGVAP